MDITRFELEFPASNVGHNIFACVWRDAERENYKAVIQLVHGMAEHILRYEDFAVYLAKHGYVVCGNDHAGHGQSADEADLGYFGKKDNSWQYLIDDMNYLKGVIALEFPDIPYVMLGHSMGSFLAREFTAKYGNELSAAIFMGTGGKKAGIDAAIALSKHLAEKHPKEKGKIIDKIVFSGYNRKVENPSTSFDWLSTDAKQVEKYINDDRCGFLFTFEGYRDLLEVNKEVNTVKWAKSLPAELPILLISGTDDPVGDYGKGVRKVYKLLLNSGCANTDIKLLKGARHEILNDVKKDRVYKILLKWIEQNVY